MSNYSVLKQDINNNIYENQTQQITGTVLNAILNEMTASLGAGYQFAGVATLGMNPGDPDQRVFYLAGEGIYTNFGGLQVPQGKLGVLKWDFRWTLQTIDGLGGGGANLTGYVSLASTDDLPEEGQPTLGYLCGTNLYLYVGTGGDTKEGKYQNCGSFRGPQGLQGDPGVGIASVTQTTTSTEDEGINVITVTKEDGTQSTFQVRNGSKGSQGIQGPQGVQGEPGRLQAQYKEVETLPTASADTMDFIYLVESQTPSVYDMYYTEENQGTYSWKGLGTTAVQLSDYATKAEVNQLEAKLTEKVGGTSLAILVLEQGAIVDGEDSASPWRIRTNNYIKADRIKVTIAGTIGKAYIVGYDDNNTYVSGYGWITSTETVSIAGATKYRLVFSKVPDGNILPEEYDTIGVTVEIEVNPIDEKIESNIKHDFGDFGPVAFTIPSGSTHSSLDDQLSVSVGNGKQFLIHTNLAPSSSVTYRCFVNGGGSYNLSSVKNLGNGVWLFQAPDDIVSIGVTVSTAVSADTKVEFGVYIGDEMALTVAGYDISILKKTKSFALIPNAAGVPNIDTTNKILNLRDCIIVTNGKSYEMSTVFPSNPEKYTQISLKNGNVTSATVIVFNTDTPDIYAKPWSSPIAENEIMLGGVRTTYGASGDYVCAEFPFAFSVDGETGEADNIENISIFSRSIPNIDTVNGTIDLGPYLIVYYNGKYYNTASETGTFRNIPFRSRDYSTTSWKLVYNTDTHEFRSIPFSDAIDAKKEIVFGTIYLDWSWNFLSAKLPFEFTINGKFQSEYYNDVARSSYYGERITLKPTLVHKTPFSLGTSKIFVAADKYGDKIVALFHESEGYGKGGIFNADGSIINEIDFPYGAHYYPHNNVCCFGNESIDENPLPLLYVSQWTYSSERGALVYNLTETGGVYSANLVQFIKPAATIDADKFGSGATDWVVDKENSLLYSVTYRETTDGGTSTNTIKVCKFALPAVSDGATVELGTTDILDYFEVPHIGYMQDKKIANNMLVMGCGIPGNERSIYAISLLLKKRMSRIDLTAWFPTTEQYSEPESLYIDDGKVMFSFYGFATIHELILD